MAPTAANSFKQSSRPLSSNVLNRLPAHAANTLFHACCPDATYANLMQKSRPFSSLDSILETSRTVWNGLSLRQWRAIFRAHGSLEKTPEGMGLLSTWVRKENAAVRYADPKLRQEICELEKRYLKRHGFPFVICASEKSAKEVRNELRERLGNETDQEVYEAAVEQIRVTELRLKKALAEARYM